MEKWFAEFIVDQVVQSRSEYDSEEQARNAVQGWQAGEPQRRAGQYGPVKQTEGLVVEPKMIAP